MTFVSTQTPPAQALPLQPSADHTLINSVSVSPALPALRTASSHLVLLTEVLETYQPSEFPQMDVLSALKTDLVAAMNTYRIACQTDAPMADQLMREADLMWHCNQCDYYLSQRQGSPLVTLSPERGRWQIKKVTKAIVGFKLLTHIRMLMSGPNTLSISWREILPGIQLWL